MDNFSKDKIILEEKLVLKLYVSGMTPTSMEAIENIKRLCDDLKQNAFELEIIDLYKNPELAIEAQIIFSPSLIKQSPLPKRTLIGTFADTDKVKKALGIRIKE